MSLVAPTSLTPDILFRLGTFVPHLNSEFAVKRGEEWVTLTLAEANDSSRPPEGETSQAFSLIFSATPDKPLQQGIHDFQHSAIGSFEMFIVPIQCPLPNSRWYQAVINSAGTF
jgi:hypothetical protein